MVRTGPVTSPSNTLLTLAQSPVPDPRRLDHHWSFNRTPAHKGRDGPSLGSREVPRGPEVEGPGPHTTLFSVSRRESPQVSERGGRPDRNKCDTPLSAAPGTPVPLGLLTPSPTLRISTRPPWLVFLDQTGGPLEAGGRVSDRVSSTSP